MLGMLGAAFYAWHRILEVREELFYGNSVGFAEADIPSLFAGDFSGIARIKMILAGIALYHFAVFCHFEAF